MTRALDDIPELRGARHGAELVRIPPEVDVPLTARVRRLIDSAAFRRLSRISQLGLVGLVYPGANHTRHEHSLGVYLAAIEYLERLASDDRFAEKVSAGEAEAFLAAALLHDIGHFPFGHPLEDLGLSPVLEHEALARRQIVEGEIGQLLCRDWGLEPGLVADIVANRSESAAGRIVGSMLSGPIDVDKIDYLMRDSLHAGVPYGRHFDRRRLVGSLCLNARGDGLAITEKGKTAAEMMVFARYVMFSEVYWHHAVRAATAMLQRACYQLWESLDVERLITLSDAPMIETLVAAGAGTPAGELLEGLFGERRRLYKRLCELSYFEKPEVYARIAHRPFGALVEIAERMATALHEGTGIAIAPHEVLVDAPPLELEVDFDIDVFYRKTGEYRRLGDVSPVVRTLARDQFDNHVKRVRIFVHPRIAEEVRKHAPLVERLSDCIGE